MQSYLHTAIVTDAVCREHRGPLEHPERPERLDAILNGLAKSDVMDLLVRSPSRAATLDELKLCHTAAYIELVQKEIAGGAAQLSTGDAFICPQSWEPALRAAGCSLSAVDAVFERRAKNVFCAVRPPGHHATADTGMGFCIFNNAAIAARYAQKKYGAQRVAIVDWDVHHGNGTQDIFYADGSVFYFSTHQAPLYPGTGLRDETGIGAGLGTTLNVPVAEGTTGREMSAIFREQLVPAMKIFRPDFVVVSAGFDARVNDPLGGLLLTDHDFADLTDIVLDIAKEFSEGRLISILEGGYNLAGLASAAVQHVRTLAGHL